MHPAALLLLPAVASAKVPVLISGFEAQHDVHQAIAARLPGAVAKRMFGDPALEVLRVSDVPWIEGKTGPDYLAACPAEEVLGCSFALAEVAEARWAVTGIVRDEPVFDDEVDPGTELELTVLDIEEQREAWSFVFPHDRAAEAELTRWALDVVVALVEGREPPAPEPDEEPELIEDEPVDPEADLTGLERELGEVGHPEGVEDLGEGRQEREPMTMDQLMEEYGEAEPWLDLDLTPQRYLRWWNSGWGYRTWQDKLRGRKGQLVLRAFAGWGAGPRGGHYNAQYAIDTPSSRTVIEYYSWQAAVQGSGLSFGMNAGYGLTPRLELELGLARHGGPFTTDVTKEYLGDDPEVQVADEGLQGMLEASLGARFVPLPFASLRPQIGAGLLVWHGSQGDGHAELPPPPVELPIPAANTLVGAYGLLGAELALNDTVGILVQAPVQYFFAGTAANVHDDDHDYIAHKIEPPTAPSLGWAVQAGVQLHLGK